MPAPSRRHFRDVLPDLFDRFDAPSMPTWMPTTSGQFRIEDYVDDSTYVVRAELAGVDPDRDVDITLDEGVLTIQAERRQERADKEGSEIRYGALTRSVRLPGEATPDKATASYDNGILTVKVPLTEKPVEQARHIPIAKKG